MQGHETALCDHTHISITYDPSTSEYQLQDCTTDDLYLLGDNTSFTNHEIPVLSFPTANFIGQLSHILTNNLNLKGSI